MIPPNESNTTTDFGILDAVWLWDNEHTYYPAVIMSINHSLQQIVLLKYDNYIWRKCQVSPKQISPRTVDFSEYLFEVRKSLLSSTNIKFALPK